MDTSGNLTRVVVVVPGRVSLLHTVKLPSLTDSTPKKISSHVI